MRKITCIMFAIVCLTGAAIGDSRVGPFASWLTSNDEDAFGGGLMYEWLLHENLGIDVRASYVTGNGIYLVPLELGLVGILPLEKESLYAGAGIGYYIPEDTSADYGSGEVTGPDPSVGFYAVAGIRIPMADTMEFFAEAKYTTAEDDSRSDSSGMMTWSRSGTTDHGMDLDGFGANLGFLWKL